MNDSKLGGILGIAFFFVFMGFIIYSIFFSTNQVNSQTSDTISPTLIYFDTPTPYPTVDSSNIATQSYWYCWNNGNPSPHHLGYRTSGDHYCTNRELGH